jgi:hypothetical protein
MQGEHMKTWKAATLIAGMVSAAGLGIIAVGQLTKYDGYQSAIDTCKVGSGAEVGDDGQTLTLNKISLSGPGSMSASDAACVLKELHISSAALNRMGQTNALAGVQSADWDGNHATWTYSPDDGLNLVISRTHG